MVRGVGMRAHDQRGHYLVEVEVRVGIGLGLVLELG